MNFPFQLFQRSYAATKLYPSRRRKIVSSATANMFDYVNRIAQDKREDGSCSSKGASFASFESHLFCTVTRVYSVFENAIHVVVGDTQSSSSVERAPWCASFHLKSSQQKYFTACTPRQNVSPAAANILPWRDGPGNRYIGSR